MALYFIYLYVLGLCTFNSRLPGWLFISQVNLLVVITSRNRNQIVFYYLSSYDIGQRPGTRECYYPNWVKISVPSIPTATVTYIYLAHAGLVCYILELLILGLQVLQYFLCPALPRHNVFELFVRPSSFPSFRLEQYLKYLCEYYLKSIPVWHENTLAGGDCSYMQAVSPIINYSPGNQLIKISENANISANTAWN